MKINFQIIVIIALVTVLCGGTAAASEARQAVLSDVHGEVLIRQGSGDWQMAQPGIVLNPNDEIKTSKGGSAEILLDRGEVGSVKIRQKSQFKIDALDMDRATGEKSTFLNLAVGKVLVQTGKLQGNSKFEVRTPTATTGVRGTLFEVTVE